MPRSAFGSSSIFFCDTSSRWNWMSRKGSGALFVAICYCLFLVVAAHATDIHKSHIGHARRKLEVYGDH